MKQKMKIGLFGTGLDTYWPQFDGLRDSLLLYQDTIRSKMESLCKVEVVDAGLVDNPEKAFEAADKLSSAGVELVFLYMSTYCLSSTVLPIAQRLHCPIIILNIQPVAVVDYNYINSLGDRGKMTGHWLMNCQACSAPEVASVLKRSGLRFEIVTGYLDDPIAWKAIEGWIQAANVCHSMRNNRLGILGHYYGGMLDVYTDITRQSAVFGTHMEMLEMCELKALRDSVTSDEINRKVNEFYDRFSVSDHCSTEEIIRAAQTSVALDKLIAAHHLGSMAYYYEGNSGNDYENIVTSVIAGNTLLTGQGIPIAGECEVKNAQAMKILSELGAGGSFAEFYAIDFDDDIVMLGHDGPAHCAIADGAVGLVPLPVYHGKPGKGLSIQMSVKCGPVTLLSVCEGMDGIYLLAAEGEVVSGPTFQIGNTNSRYRFPCGARAFIDQWSKQGPSHHCAIGVGHWAATLDKIAFLLGINIVKI